MCLIIDRPAGTQIPEKLISRGLSLNSDGWGIMASVGGQIMTAKGLQPKKFRKALKAFKNAPLTVHFRYTTHGGTSLANCHPFPILNGAYAVMHNGIISHAPELDPSRSDTWHFCEHILAPMLATYPEKFGTADLEHILSRLIGTGNKLVILRRDGLRQIINPKQGIEWEGLWLSNSYSLPLIGFGSAKTQLSRWSDPDTWRGREDYVRDDRGVWRSSAWEDSETIDSIDVAADGKRVYYPPAKAEAVETDDSPEDEPRRLEHPWSIEDFQDWTADEIRDWCYTNHEDVAEMIIDTVLR